ncbi:2-oxo acid dehydrogenase subunit E2 [Buchnera aphidicola]|uniref:Dihydrolipoamide acetyltransferase component of pyruvate dehydrogenase complex n=1 Tax=Buchnera aphidicola str. USDA (Myzus persicae) TaxID=1009856 RepID=W0P3Z6_BUCMP|nr:2-oxo acid dehydrogenase subunit E2 [Buchnera aphidicola]AHG60167.1 Acef [Buchnera aphidicola str. USDA (Myzus persicae)]AHG60746.1 Acef [Buchnera aphidicola str. W106 (Myzus persicae)]AHG61319.1 Acef [Buchnera aphidicola str. G002 (Myzus persicae)]AHG61892.1 Acef [Buchnera aphidicola str. F009 (Myzus persicae)]WAI03142.1 MAG: 2-oxo acid dehydrogenase subunit E2 [Buchnera aphidicola (Myzus persicae)]
MDIEVKIPDIGLDEVEIIEILVKIDEKVKIDQGLITVEGEKASMEIPSPISGIVKKIHVKIGEKVQTSSTIMTCTIDDTDINTEKNNENFLKKEINLSNDDVFLEPKKNIFVHATPVVRRLARNLNVNLYNVTGTGPKKRILKEDVELYKNDCITNFLKENNQTNFNNSNSLITEEIELSSLQKITGNNLHKNWMNIPHVTQFDEVNITILEKFRQKYNFEHTNKNNKITILVFIIKVVAAALEKFPIFNSSFNVNNKKLILKKYINIGIAVDVGDGLLVPVLKNINQKNIQQISDELILISEKARTRKLNASDTTKGCFTISNLGGIGGTWFSPIINSPEVAILGVSKSQIKPLWNGKEFVPALMLPLSLSYDHRIINGADAARFITFVNKLLSDMHFLVM